MLDIADELHRWSEAGRDFAVATVVGVGGSAPRGLGAAMAVDRDGTVVGSVSGGCVEGAVHELCRQALEDGESVRETFGYSDDDAFAVGLTCGGVLDVLVVPVRGGDVVSPVYASVLAAAATGEPAAVARVVSGPEGMLGRAIVVRGEGPGAGAETGEGRLSVRGQVSYEGGLGGLLGLDVMVAAEVRAFLDAGRTGILTVGEQCSRCGALLTGGEGERCSRNGAVLSEAEAEVKAAEERCSRCGTLLTVTTSERRFGCGSTLAILIESVAPPPRMIIFGAIDFAAALTVAGKFLGHHVTVCDARPVFTTAARFPYADEIVVDWPHRYLDRTATDARTALCVLTHDPKFDIPLLERALRLPVAYVGAMGSRRTHLDRLDRLREVGLGEDELSRLHSPIGLDLGARTPEETALSIAAEIVAERRGGSGLPLTGAHTPIHHDAPHHDAPHHDLPRHGSTRPGPAYRDGTPPGAGFLVRA